MVMNGNMGIWHGGRICPYLMWGRTCPRRGECDSTSFCVAGAVVLEVGKDRFPAVTVSSNILFKQLPACSACYVATSVSSIFQDVLDATLYHPSPLPSKTLWMLLFQHAVQGTSKLVLRATL